jgi:hypothetical protein
MGHFLAGGGIRRYAWQMPCPSGAEFDNWQILPWDSDIDVQVSETTIAYLAKYYNMTEYHFSLPEIETGRNYLLEINPHYNIRGTEDKFNVIDARWIDTDTGLFIDISTVRKNYTAIAQGIEGALMCKDRHHYLVRQPKALRFSLRVWCPLLTRNTQRSETCFHYEIAFSRACMSKSRSTMHGSSRRSTARKR